MNRAESAPDNVNETVPLAQPPAEATTVPTAVVFSATLNVESEEIVTAAADES